MIWRRLATLALATACQAQAAVQTVTFTCAVAYMPQRSTWVRQVQVDWEQDTVLAVRIDGLSPHSFVLHDEGLSTAIDNERIALDWQQALWRSDFRGLATGQGRCEIDSP